MKLVDSIEKPTHDRAECPECGIVSHGIWMQATPEVNVKTGRIKKKGALMILYCAECYREGRYTEVGR